LSAPTIAACPLTVFAWRLGALPLSELWWRYIELGGNRPQAALAAYLAGATEWPATEHNALAHGLNECLWDAGCSSLAPYRAPGEARPWPAA
jgi:hypothetical protein